MATSTDWDEIYRTRDATKLSWFQEHAHVSRDLIRQTRVSRLGSIIDVGGGASTLVDDLLADGFRDITVLDLSHSALAAARSRLGDRASEVRWIVDDITRVKLPAHHYEIWHDRAVFHFLNAVEDRRSYVEAVRRSVRPGGHVIVATFAPDGPLRCSGLPVVRYSPDTLHQEFGDSFELVEHAREAHQTPTGAVQQFIYCYCRKPR